MSEPRSRRGVKVAESVARDIVSRIHDEGLRPGAQLPPETQMLEQYGVGRGSLREALRILEVHGLITLKPGPGGGPVVNGVRTGDFGRMSTLYFQAAGMTFRQLIEARLVMEPVMARLAAERRDEALLEQLRAAADGPVGDDAGYLSSGLEFHRLISSMSGNGIMNLFSHSLEDIFHDRIHGLLFPPSRRARVRQAHLAIGQAIVEGRPADAERLMREHMVEYVDYVKKRHPGLMDEVVDWV